jgi:hypothetical protein
MSLLCSIPTARWMAAAGDLDQAGIPVPAIRRYSPAAIDSSRERYAGSSTSNGVGFWAGLLGEEPATENHALALPR